MDIDFPDWPTRLSGPAVSPAAGSAAALTAALGVGLLIKLARRSQPEDIPKHGYRLGRLLEAQDQFTLIAEDDASAIKDWLSRRGLKRDDPRRQAAAEALTSVPLRAAELCCSVQIVAEPFLQRGHAPTVADGRAGNHLISTSQEIFCTLVEADLDTVADPAMVKTIGERLEKVKRYRPETASREGR